MAFNGSGVFARLYNWVADHAANIKIRDDRMDAEMDGFATGLSNAICRDGQSTITADISFNAKKITGLGDATAATDAMSRQAADARYKWVTLQDTTLAVAAQNFQFSLGGYQRCRILLTVVPNPACASDFNVLWLSSTNGGVSFDSGSNNYYNVLQRTLTTASTASGGVGSIGAITSSFLVDKDSPAPPFMLEAHFDAGGSKNPRFMGQASYFDGSDYCISAFMGQRQSSTKVTDFLIGADFVAAFGIGSRILVEAC